MFERLPAAVSICEVGLRDGLQNEPTPVPLQGKLLLIQSLMDAGLRRIEATSFVSPRWVPQLADAEALVSALPPQGDVRFSALCPNAKGLERALHAGLGEIAVFLSASETHNLKNTNKTIARSLAVFEEVVPVALEHGVRVRAYISTVWGCPYEGAVAPERSLELAGALLDLGCYQVSLGDTIGVATPMDTARVCELFLEQHQVDQVALHLHDTRGTALANVLVGLQLGVRHFDAALGGLGGCPYAPGAAGNLATEDLVYMLAGMDIETGIDLPRLVDAGDLAERLVGRKLSGKVHQAGLPRQRP